MLNNCFVAVGVSRYFVRSLRIAPERKDLKGLLTDLRNSMIYASYFVPMLRVHADQIIGQSRYLYRSRRRQGDVSAESKYSGRISRSLLFHLRSVFGFFSLYDSHSLKLQPPEVCGMASR